VKAVIVVVPKSEVLWKCSAAITGDATTMGVRQTIYRLAFENVAFYDTVLGRQASIRYDESRRLLLDLVFKTEDHIYGFETAARKYFEGFNYQLNSTLSLSLESFEFSKFVTEVSAPALQRVYNNHYSPSDNDICPQTSASQLYEHSPTLEVDINTPLFFFQRIENEKYFSHSFYRPDLCHLIDKASCVGDFHCYKYSENNIILLSKDFHNLLDGINGEDPGILLAFKSQSDVANNETGRYEVEIFVEFYDSMLSRYYSSRLKPDSQRLSDLVWVTKLWVANVTDFRVCLGWKTEKTIDLWRDKGRNNYLNY
jgi:hypothetical protein